MSAPASPDEVLLNVRCHCQTTSFKLKIPRANFPLKSAVCHCRSCRHVTGQLFATFAVIPTPVPQEIQGDTSGRLASYRSSPTLLRLFCKNCGASVANVDTAGEEDEWELSTGVIEFVDDEAGHDGKFDRVQLWIEDVQGDGGAAAWVNNGALAGMERHLRGRESEIVGDEALEVITAGSDTKQQNRHLDEIIRESGNQLDVRCHCGSINFNISRPTQDHNQGTGKFGASIDACTSCRLVTGFEITSWATVPRHSIRTAASDFEAYLSQNPNLKHYKTSVDVSRHFCNQCGATIFYQKHGHDSIDVAIGVLDPKVNQEARAEDWLAWQKYPRGVSYPEDAVDKHFVKQLADGYRYHIGEDRV